ncbi:hypothetical protein [Veillonella seminalis]|uniref:hypothetical protein n=1 Tax=Veillonella seminalis TaxID=1502943 RepID=UPI0023F1D95A|nr:hypothetical protein [Veillonella seminalis]
MIKLRKSVIYNKLIMILRHALHTRLYKLEQGLLRLKPLFGTLPVILLIYSI